MNSEKSTKRILYISYDGMTDPLGQSQVLPYIIGLSQNGYKFTLLSCEKQDRFKKSSYVIKEIVDKHGIEWVPIPFTTSPPILAKYYDLYNLERKAFQLHELHQFDMVHCRSYISAAIGNKLKRRYGVKFFFDMRGFWVDERVEGGMWDLKNPIYKLAYKSYKKKEASYISNADAIVSLTQAGKQEIETWDSYNNAPIPIIPCSADFDHFQGVNPARKQASRKLLKIEDSAFLLSYLGSIGTWYLLTEMLQFFQQLKLTYPHAKFLFITPDKPENILTEGEKLGLSQADFIIKSANRKEVPEFLWASDLNIFFIKPCYSKIASSPTKLGEILASGIPVICNAKVGDVKQIIEETQGGIALDDLNKATYKEAINRIPELLRLDPIKIRENAFAYYDLSKAIHSYVKIYQEVLV